MSATAHAKSKLWHGLVIGVLSAACALCLWHLGFLNWLERPLWDLRARLFASPSAATDRIRLIYLDQSSLDWGRREQGWPWPWPREAYAAIVDFCRRSEAESLAFDVLFTEPSRDGVEDDLAFREAIAACPVFAAAVMPTADESAPKTWPDGFRFKGIRLDPQTGSASIRPPEVAAVSFPIPEIGEPCGMLGSAHALPDSDNIVRRLAPAAVFDGRLLPALGLASVLVSTNFESAEFGKRSLNIGGISIPLDSSGRTILRWRGPHQVHRAVSAQAVIQSEVRLREGAKPVLDPSEFKGRHVLFGFTAPALGDLHATPMGALQPGVTCHATMLDNILAGDFMSDAPPWACAAWTLLMGIAGGILGRFCSRPWLAAVLLLCSAALPSAAGLVAYQAGFWLPVAPAHIASPCGVVAALVVNYAVEGRQKRFIKNAFKQYLSPHFIEKLIEDPTQLRLGGEARDLTIFFSDVKGFTSISESLDAERLTSLLNEYLTAMTDIIMEEGGTVDKYEGDAIIAFWNAPVAVPDHATRGVNAAIRCQAALAILRPELARKYGHGIYCRIGMNTGRVVVGNMGSSQRFNYTFLGDAGNLASRLEGANKIFGTNIMISEFTARSLGYAFYLRELSRLRVVGRHEPVRVFEPMTHDDAGRRSDVLETFSRGLQAFYAGKFSEAAALFETIAAADSPAKAYVEKCRTLLQTPPTSWSGVWELTEK